MVVEYESDKLNEILRLTKENNKMLHTMRRNAFLGGVLKFAMWVALLVIPLWLYMQYLAPVMESMLDTINQIQGTRTSAQTQLTGLNDALQQLREQFPQYFGGN